MPAQCPTCGGTEFELYDGSNICFECGAHQENFVEIVAEEFSETPHVTSISRSLLINGKTSDNTYLKGQIGVDDNWSTFEAFNIILKDWANCLVNLGASPKFKDVLLRLWIRWLQVLKVAFVDEEEEGKLLSSSGKEIFFRRDMRVLRKVIFKQNSQSNKRRKYDNSSSLDNIKRKLSYLEMTKNDFAVSRTKLNILSQEIQSLNASQVSANEDAEQVQPNVLELTNYESQTMNFSDEEIDDNNATIEEKMSQENMEKNPVLNQTRRRTFYEKSQHLNDKICKKSCTMVNLENLLALVYLALLVSEEDILLIDLLRWCRKGYIPYTSAGCLVPDWMRMTLLDMAKFNRSIPSSRYLKSRAEVIASKISLKSVSFPSYKFICRKFMTALNLPADIEACTTSFLTNLEIQNCAQFEPTREINVAAAILLSFKTNFGLDDKQEELISDWAEKINKILKVKKNNLRLFSYREWHCYINELNWWVQRVDPDSPLTKNSKLFKFEHGNNIKELSNQFWSGGYWNIPVSSRSNRNYENTPWDFHLLKCTLGLNKTLIEDAMNRKSHFSACKTPYVDLLSQYLQNGTKMDQSTSMKKIAKKLQKVNFINHQFDWIASSEKFVNEFKKFNSNIRIVKIPFYNPKIVYRKCTIPPTCSDGDEELVLVVPNPMDSFWVSPRPLKTSNSEAPLPKSFLWLLKTLSDFCETDEAELLHQYRLLEQAFVSKCRVGKSKIES